MNLGNPIAGPVELGVTGGICPIICCNTEKRTETGIDNLSVTMYTAPQTFGPSAGPATQVSTVTGSHFNRD